MDLLIKRMASASLDGLREVLDSVEGVLEEKSGEWISSPDDNEAVFVPRQSQLAMVFEDLIWRLGMDDTLCPANEKEKFEIVSELLSVPWFCIIREGRSLLEEMIRVRNVTWVDEILKNCSLYPNAPQHPLKLPGRNLLIAALEHKLPYPTFEKMATMMGAAIDSIDEKIGLTPLLYLARSDEVSLYDGVVCKDSDGLCKKLVQLGAHPMSRCKTKKGWTTPFHCAVQKKKASMANLLFESLVKTPPSKKQVNVKDFKGNSILQLVIRNGWLKIAEGFVGWGASILNANKRNECALVDFVNAKQENPALLNAILEQWDPQDVLTALSLDLPSHDQQLVNDFLERHALDVLKSEADNQRKLQVMYQQAVDRQCLLAVKFLKKHCKELESFQCDLHEIIGDAENNVDFIKEVVRLGADVNSKSKPVGNGGAYIIHQAIYTGCVEVVEFLLNNGARLDVADQQGETPLHAALKVKTPQKKKELARLIASRAPDLIDTANKDGYCPGNTMNKTMKRLLSGVKKSQGKEEAPSEPAVEVAVVEKAAPKLQQPAASTAATSRSPSIPEKPPPQGEPEQQVVEPPVKVASVMEKLIPPWESKDDRSAKLKDAIQKAKMLIWGADELASDRQRVLENERTDSDSEEVRAELQGVMGERAEGGYFVGDHVDGLGEEQGAMDEDERGGGVVWEGERSGNTCGTLPDKLPWGMQITKEARDGWAAMDEYNRRKVWELLCQIGEGKWQIPGVGKAIRLCFAEAPLDSAEMWKIKINKSGRIVFEVCVDFDEAKAQYMDIIRVWVVTLFHRRYEKGLERLKDSYKNSGCILWKPKLQPVSKFVPHSDRIKEPRIPRLYEILDGVKTSTVNSGNGAGKGGNRNGGRKEEMMELKVPTNAGEDTFNLLKFHTIGSAMVKCILDGLDDRNVDFPFKVSPAEKKIIEMSPTSPRSIILVGRSGTGKTTCAVYRMWAQWLASQNHREDPYHQIFLTASATLKEQVEKTFRKLQAAVLSKDELEEVINLGKNAYQPRPFRDIPSAAFPLFLTTHQFLRMLDGTLKQPFFPRNEDGTLLHDHDDDILDDPDGMGLLVSLDDCDSEVDGEEEGFDEGAELGDGHERGGEQARDKPRSSDAMSRQRVLLTYNIFEQKVWRKISNKGGFKDLMPSLVLQEILSYIKGSLEALQCEEGHLSLEDYLKVGKKRAPNYSQDLRVKVYEVFKRYKRVMKDLWLYDTTDLVGHIYRQINKDGYNGTKINSIFRDEVQDFTQAELLLDLRVASDLNGLFYCGDTCQTITRGVGFRFDDIRTLFFEEAAMHKQTVGLPTIENLLINYRTHSGILNIACSIVDLLAWYFPQFMDKLPRESSFFKGPQPYFMENTDPQDILNLVIASGSASDSEVQFGAHQAILVRNKDGFKSLPRIIQESALILTIPQAKGLEFDDVFIVDFFKDSPASSRDWRVLMGYLEGLEANPANGEGCALAPFDLSKLDKEMQGYLRREKFDADRHILLCEELKHLYTAVTRAKSNLIFFDSHPEKRAPFFHFLQRLGLVKVMSKAGFKESTLVLSKSASKPEDWVARGKNFMDNRNFELALRCFESAKDPVWSLVAYAQILIQKAGNERSIKEKKKVYSEAGYRLMMACANYGDAIEIDGKTVRKWLLRASAAFSHSSEPLQAAAIFTHLDLLRKAKDMYIKAKEFGMAAEVCEKLGLLAEACKLYVCKNKKKKDYVKAFRILNGSHRVQLEAKTKQRIAETIFYGSQMKKGAHRTAEDKDMMRSACKHMASEKMQTLLSELGEWDILAEHLEPAEAAKLLAALGRFQEAIDKMGDKDDFTEVEQWKMLHGCLLMIGTSEAFSKAYELCGQGPLSDASKVKTTLAEAAAFGRVGGYDGNIVRLKENLREAYNLFAVRKNVVGQLECLSRLLTIGSTGSPANESQHELERLDIEIRPLCSTLVESMEALLTHGASNVATMVLYKLQSHFNVFGLSEWKDRIMYRMTNARFLEALRQGGLAPDPLPERVKPTLDRSIKLKCCKAAIAIDFYNHARVVFFHFLQSMHKGVIARSAEMNSKDMLKIKDGRSSTMAKLEKEQVEFLAKGLLICSTLRSVFKLHQYLPKEMEKAGWCLKADYKTFANLCMERQWQCLLGARWSGYATTRSIKFDKQWYFNTQKACDEVWTGSSELRTVGYSIRNLQNTVAPVQAVVDPNIALWHLRRYLNLREHKQSLRIQNSMWDSMHKLGYAFSRRRRQNALDSVPRTDVKINVRKQMWSSPKSEGDADILQPDGQFLAFTLKSFLESTGLALRAFGNLNKFIGRCAYFETNMKAPERPRLCVEGFLELLEWQTVLLLPGLSSECVLPRHIVISMNDAYNGDSIEDYVFRHWQKPTLLASQDKRHYALREFPKLIQMMWYFVNRILPEAGSPDRAVSMEQHLSRLFVNRLPLHVCGIQLPEVAPVSDWTLPHVQNCKRAVALIGCTLLAAAAEVAKSGDELTTKFLPPLVACVKNIKVPGHEVKLARTLNNAAWTLADLTKSLQRTCADLNITIMTLTPTGMIPVKVPNALGRLVSPKAKLAHKKLTMSDLDEKRAKTAKLYDLPNESALFIAPQRLAVEVPRVIRSDEQAALTIQEAFKEYLKFVKGVRAQRGTKWHRRLSRWHERAKATLRKSKILADIDSAREEGYGDFRNPGRRLEWVHLGLGFQPLCRDVCTVCPTCTSEIEVAAEGEGLRELSGMHNTSNEHLDHLNAFKGYETVQAQVAALMENLAGIETEMNTIKNSYPDDPDVGVRLMEMARELSTDALKKSCLEMEEARVWTNWQQVKDLVYGLDDTIKRCHEALEEIKEAKSQEEGREEHGMDPESDYHEDEGDFTVVTRKKSSKGKRKKKNNAHMKKKGRGSKR